MSVIRHLVHFVIGAAFALMLLLLAAFIFGGITEHRPILFAVSAFGLTFLCINLGEMVVKHFL